MKSRRTWQQQVVAPGHAAGFDGVINDYYLLRTTRFEPNGTLGAEALAAENIHAFRWWSIEELQAHKGEAVFGPRDLPALIVDLRDHGLPPAPLLLGP